MSRLAQSRSQTAPLPDVSTPRLRSPQPRAHANPCCTACPSHPPDSAAMMESAFPAQENPLRLVFRERALAHRHDLSRIENILRVERGFQRAHRRDRLRPEPALGAFLL